MHTSVHNGTLTSLTWETSQLPARPLGTNRRSASGNFAIILYLKQKSGTHQRTEQVLPSICERTVTRGPIFSSKDSVTGKTANVSYNRQQLLMLLG